MALEGKYGYAGLVLNGGQGCVTFFCYSTVFDKNTSMSRKFSANFSNYRGGGCLVLADRGGGGQRLCAGTIFLFMTTTTSVYFFGQWEKEKPLGRVRDKKEA